MNLQVLSAHTIDLDLLPEIPLVLDVGCRNWDFTDDILRLRPKAQITAIDPGFDIRPHRNEAQVKFLRCALVGNDRNRAWCHSFSTGEANYVNQEVKAQEGESVYPVSCCNMRLITPADQPWDVVKLDCEGSEFEILENWPGPIARQISVEFHDWGHLDRYSPLYYFDLFAALGKFGYRLVQHELSKQGEGTGHWDSLLLLP